MMAYRGEVTCLRSHTVGKLKPNADSMDPACPCLLACASGAEAANRTYFNLQMCLVYTVFFFFFFSGSI